MICRYSVVDVKKYRKATSYSRSVQLLGYTVGAVLGQVLVSFNLMPYDDIVVLTLVLTTIALFTSFLLPMPQRSMFFHRRNPGTKTGDAAEHTAASSGEVNGGDMEKRGETQDNPGKAVDEKEDLEELVVPQTCGKVILHMYRDFRQCYSSRQLLYWSVWWAMATCGYNQTVNYVQVSYKAFICRHTSPVRL